MDPTKERIVGQEKLPDGTLGEGPKLSQPNLLSSILPAIPLVPLRRPKLLVTNRKDRKVSSACSLCRKAKKKCDGCYPCSPCVSLKKPGACIFDHDNDGRRKYALKKQLEDLQRERKHLQDIFNCLRDTDAKSAAVLHAKIRQGLTIDELTEYITQEEEGNTGSGVTCEKNALPSSLPLQLPGPHEVATASISSKEDWELPLPVDIISIQNVPTAVMPFPLAQEGVISDFSATTEATTNARDIKNRASILWAAANGDETMMALLLEANDTHLAFTNFYSQTPLSLAAENGHKEIVRLLMKRNDIGINSTDLDGQTALAWAAFNGHPTIVQLLLERDDLEANSKDIDGNTPLSWAAKNGHDMVVALLLERYDVEISPVDNCGRTPLSLATGKGHECIMRRLSVWDDSPGL